MTRPFRISASSVLILLVLIGAAELFGRFVLGLGNPVLVQIDPACGYILKPNQHLTRFFARTDTNNYGMRSAPIQIPKRQFRVLFVGDSLTYGTSHVDQSDIFPEIIGRELGIETLNASAGAWAIWNEVQFVRSRGTFDADRVVLVLNNGDLTQPPATYADASKDLPVKRPACALCELWARGVRPRLFGDARQDAGLRESSDEKELAVNLGELDELLTLLNPSCLTIVYLPFRKDIAERPRSTILPDWAHRHRVFLLDLTSIERSYPTGAITLDGSHLNKRGHRMVASALESVLRPTGYPSPTR